MKTRDGDMERRRGNHFQWERDGEGEGWCTKTTLKVTVKDKREWDPSKCAEYGGKGPVSLIKSFLDSRFRPDSLRKRT